MCACVCLRKRLIIFVERRESEETPAILKKLFNLEFNSLDNEYSSSIQLEGTQCQPITIRYLDLSKQVAPILDLNTKSLWSIVFAQSLDEPFELDEYSSSVDALFGLFSGVSRNKFYFVFVTHSTTTTTTTTPGDKLLITKTPVEILKDKYGRCRPLKMSRVVHVDLSLDFDLLTIVPDNDSCSSCCKWRYWKF